jgi:hypothetical protein
MKGYFISMVCFFISITAIAQTLPMARNIQAAVKKGTRTMDGRPGKNYWQNTATYNISVSFDPSTRLVSGTEEIDYVNNSGDSLRSMRFKLYPNLYKKETLRTSSIKTEDLTDGVQISSIAINNQKFDSTKLRIDGTEMTVGARSLPGQTMHFNIAWSYTLNKTSHIRTGEIEPGADFVAYFFPRIAVYDDIDGWNTYPYNGTQEFYNDFCKFNVSITVPNNFVVWATGSLNNCTDVLEKKYCDRIAQAEVSDAVTTVIDSFDLKQRDITRQNAFNTWKFSATDVTDFVFAVSDHYLWKSSSLVVDPVTKRRSRVDAAFNPKHKDYFEVVDFARKTLWAMSYSFPKWPYPYPHETVFDGLDQMEYPMMVNDNPLPDRSDAIELTDHEIFHTMFPFYMGINETKYAWMDEGWATIGEWLISPMIDTSIVDEYGVGPYQSQAGNENDLPITALSTETSRSYFANSYPKPALGYLYVKDMLGDELFNKGLHTYIDQWRGKHPMPYDFFYSMNSGSGKNLDWFWKKWFFDDGFPDLAIKEVKKTTNGYSITIQSIGNKPVPVDLELSWSDGVHQGTEKIHRSIAVWEKSNTVTILVNSKQTLRSVKLGSTYVPDVNKVDNQWTSK